MPDIDGQVERKYLEEVVANISSFGDSNFVNLHRATVKLVGQSPSLEVVPTMGIPVVWVGDSSAYEYYTDVGQITLAESTNDAPIAGAIIGVVIGDKFGAGFNTKDINISTPKDVTIVHNGDYALIESGVDFAGIAQPQIDAFKAQAAKQRMYFVQSAEVVEPSFLDA